MPEAIFRDGPDDPLPELTLRQLIRGDDEVSRRARSALAPFERPDVIGAGEAAGLWGGTWLLPAVGRWTVMGAEMSSMALAVLLVVGGRVLIGPSVADNGAFLVVVVVLIVVSVSVSLWAKVSIGGWVDEHNARVERIRRRVEAERDAERRGR